RTLRGMFAVKLIEKSDFKCRGGMIIKLRWDRAKTVCQNPAFDDLPAAQGKSAFNFLIEYFAATILLRTQIINWPYGVERLRHDLIIPRSGDIPPHQSQARS